jgi:hypothetical protein
MSGRYDLRWFWGEKFFFFCESLCGDKIYVDDMMTLKGVVGIKKRSARMRTRTEY